MSDFRTLHEDGPLKDVLDFISGKGVTGVVDNIGNFILGKKLDDKRKSRIVNTNIAKSAKALTCVFPVIVSKSIGIDQAVMVSKAVERKCVSMLQMLFAANQISGANNVKDYLGNFHNNISSSIDLSSMDIDDFLRYTEGFNEEVTDYVYLMKDAIEAVNEDTRRNIHHILETGIMAPAISEMRVIHELGVTGGVSRTVKTSSTTNTKKYNRKEKKMMDDSSSHRDDETEQFTPFTTGDYKNLTDVLSKQVLDSDIKKANEAQPSLMIVNFISNMVDDKGNSAGQVQSSCVIGVKAMIHYVDPQDIVNRVVLKKSDSRGLFNLIRATTREISFFKDFLFAVNRAKVDAVAKSGKGSTDRIWKLLELRADRLKGAKVSQMNQAGSAAITTLVISRAEVDHIKQFNRIDLSKPGTFLAILRGYNMMAGAIIDEVSERVDFIWDDGTSAFESLSFMSLEREETGAMYKKVLNLAMRGR